MGPITSPAQHSTTTLGDLRALAADLRREHPQAGARVDHAAFLAIFRTVERGTSPSIWWVDSETDPTTSYLVTVTPRTRCCTCQDFARRGELTPCKHLLSVEIVQRLERAEAERLDPTLAPIEYLLTPAALAALDDQRQRDAARCPNCEDFKMHGSLYCGGECCDRLVTA
jgi:hypothetical protein